MAEFWNEQPEQNGFFDKNNSKEIAYRRKMAERLLKQGEQDGTTQIVSGYAVKKSPLEGFAKALASGVGGYQERKADDMQNELDKKRSELMAKYVSAYGQDPVGASQILMQDPELSGDAMKMAVSSIDKQKELALKEADWKREAALKRELAQMRVSSSGGGLTVDPDTGQITFNGGNETQQSSAPLSNALGVPNVPLTAANMSPKDASMYAKQTRLAAEKRLNDEDFTQAASKARANKNDTNRMNELMAEQDTGGFWINTPVVGSLMKTYDPQLNEMQSIQDRLTPQQRVAGSGATSDFDARMFQNALPSPNKPKTTNENIIKAIRERENDTLQYQSYLSDFLAANNHLNGADAKWQEYVDANPIFDPEKTDMTLNSARKTYQEYFGVNSKPKQQSQNPNAGQGKPAINKDYSQIQPVLENDMNTAVPKGNVPPPAPMGGMGEQPLSFNTPQEAEQANLPIGTVIMIGGRKAVIE